jgi:hypothetical protein
LHVEQGRLSLNWRCPAKRRQGYCEQARPRQKTSPIAHRYVLLAEPSAHLSLPDDKGATKPIQKLPNPSKKIPKRRRINAVKLQRSDRPGGIGAIGRR